MCNAPRCPPTVLEAEVSARAARCAEYVKALQAYADEFAAFSLCYDDGWVPSVGLHNQLVAALVPTDLAASRLLAAGAFRDAFACREAKAAEEKADE